MFMPGTSYYYISDNVVYGDNGAELNTYDVAKAVYEPVKDNEETEERNLVCCTVFICL